MINGVVDLTELGQCKDKLSPLCVKALGSSPDIACNHTQVPIMEFLQALFTQKKLQVVSARVIFKIASEYQDKVLSNYQDKQFDITAGNMMVQLHNYAASSIVHSLNFKVHLCSGSSTSNRRRRRRRSIISSCNMNSNQ